VIHADTSLLLTLGVWAVAAILLLAHWPKVEAFAVALYSRLRKLAEGLMLLVWITTACYLLWLCAGFAFKMLRGVWETGNTYGWGVTIGVPFSLYSFALLVLWPVATQPPLLKIIRRASAGLIASTYLVLSIFLLHSRMYGAAAATLIFPAIIVGLLLAPELKQFAMRTKQD